MRCVCHFWGYYGIHVQMFKYQILFFKPLDMAACHYFWLSAFLCLLQLRISFYHKLS